MNWLGAIRTTGVTGQVSPPARVRESARIAGTANIACRAINWPKTAANHALRKRLIEPNDRPFRHYPADRPRRRNAAIPGLPDDITARVEVSPTRDPAHGDMATNAAMVCAKAARQPPAKLAAAIAEALRASPDIAEATPAGPGFVNLRLDPRVFALSCRRS